MPNSGWGSLHALANTVAVASLVAMPLFGEGQATAANDEQVLRELNAGYVRAFLNSDAEWYDRHLTPDFACILTSGAVMDRAAFLDNARKAHTTTSYDLSEITVRQHGDVALISALGTWKRSDGTSGRTRYIDVWVRARGEWKAVSAQLTALPHLPS